MNYILEINAFYRLLEGRHLSAGARVLWHELMQRANLTGWAAWITIPTAVLQTSADFHSKQCFHRAQKELIDAGLLEVKSGHAHVPNRYHLVPASTLLSSSYAVFGSSTELKAEPL